MQIHLVRHGEVANPNHIVYGDLDGFDLSPLGVRQANAAAAYLADRPIGTVVTSPLARAVQTATAIARRHGSEPILDPRLVETRQFPHWTGRRWSDIAIDHRDELDRYLEDATTVVGGHEDIHDVARRVGAAIVEHGSQLATDRELVVVGHQDPTQAARLDLTGRSLATLRHEPPVHAAVITLEGSDATGWTEVGIVIPDLGDDAPACPQRTGRRPTADTGKR